MTAEPETSARILERYNYYLRRATLHDPGRAGMIFRSLERLLGPWLPTDRSARILDVGCGEGALLSFLRSRGYSDLSGFDLSPENVALCHREGLAFVRRFDALRLREWPDADAYDLVIAFDVVEHLPKQAVAGFLEEARARLRPGGDVVVQAPNMGSLAGCHARYNDLTHEFGLTEHTALDLFTLAGFDLEQIELRPAWNAATRLGRLREIYQHLLHRLVFLSEDSSRPRISTKNLLVRARRTS